MREEGCELETHVVEKLCDRSQISLKLAMTGHGDVTRRLFMVQCDCCLQGRTKRVASVCGHASVCLFVYMKGRDPGPELPFMDCLVS